MEVTQQTGEQPVVAEITAPGLLNSIGLTQKIAEIHQLKGPLNGKIRAVQDELRSIPDGEKRDIKVKILNGMLEQQAVLNERLKEYSTLKYNAIDQIMLRILKFEHNNLFKQILAKAKIQYEGN